MSPRQLLRLFESRKSSSFDDQHTPAEIQTSETAATDHQSFLDYLLSQVRQILGTANWHDPVPAQLSDIYGLRMRLPANCLSTDDVGDAVRITGAEVGGRYQVTKADVTDFDGMPAIGMIVDKSGATTCEIQFMGEVHGLYTGLTPGRVYFLGEDGRATLTPPSPGVPHYIQKLGTALSDNVLLLQASPDLVKRI